MKFTANRIKACIATLLIASGATAQEYPNGSKINITGSGLQHKLLNPLEEGGVLRHASWQAENPYSQKSSASPKMGDVAVEIGANSKMKGSKGDFPITRKLHGEFTVMGMWVHLTKDSNVSEVGFQFKDGKGESLKYLVPADWKGWRWVELDFATAKVTQAWKQPKHDMKVDFPISGVSTIFFCKDSGPAKLSIDGLVANVKTSSEKTGNNLEIKYYGKPNTEKPNEPYTALVQLNNNTDKDQNYDIFFELQEDSKLYDKPLPDPVKGLNHAVGQESWIEHKGKRIGPQNPLTDGDIGNKAETPWGKGGTEAFQFVKLKKPMRITHMEFTCGDANWGRFVDVEYSMDGKSYSPVKGLKEFSIYHKWGKYKLPMKKPFTANFIRFRYHNKGAAAKVIRMPSEIYIYDGPADETFEIPQVGKIVDTKKIKAKVKAKSFKLFSIKGSKPLQAGGYLAGYKVVDGKDKNISYNNFFVMPADMKDVDESSRFGINVSESKYAPLHKKLGFGWVRFENHKWAFFNPKKDHFAFDGSVGPWHVNLDKVIKDYRKEGIKYLPYTFVTPEWSTSAPDNIKKNRRGYPPKDYNDYAEAIYQSVARYGNKKVDPSTLKTKDKISGLGLVDIIELWNEPGYDAPSWSAFIGGLNKYFDVFRVGAQGARRADPDTKVSIAGLESINMQLVNRMVTYKYKDGKCPLDYSDIVNVHFYSGQVDPEISTKDPNADRTGKDNFATRTYRDELRTLVDWRNGHKKEAEIWLTETGYDVGGPMGRDERYQAAKLPRCVMIALAEGVDKIFIYREKGSKPTQHAGSGLMRADETFRPSLFTTATMIRQLHGFKGQALKLDTKDKNTWIYFWKEGDKELLTAWHIGGEDKGLPLELGKATVVDAFGKTISKSADSKVNLNIFPVYISNFKQNKKLAELIKKAKIKKSKWKKLQAKRNKYKTYQFDFGTTKRLGVLKDYGMAREFTPVVAPAKYSKEAGYGFTADKTVKDGCRNYIHSNLDCDAVWVHDGNTFRIDAKRGTYLLTINAELKGSGKFVASSDQKVTKKAQSGKSMTTMEVKVGSEPLLIDLPRCGVNWITLVPKD